MNENELIEIQIRVSLPEAINFVYISLKTKHTSTSY